MKRWVFFAILFLSLSIWWLERDDLSLTAIKQRQVELAQFSDRHLLVSVTGFALAYAFLTAVSFPGAAVLSLLAGSVFGLWVGVAMVLIAATIGSVGAFMLCRFLLADWVRSKYRDKVVVMDQGFKRDGAYYLFWMRLNPVIPFFLINLGMGLTRISVWTFAWISFVGMAPGTWLYVNAGVRLGEIESVSDLMSLSVIASFVALGAIPLLFKWMFKHER